MPEKFESKTPQQRVDIQAIYNKLDYDEDINRLLGKFINKDGELSGELIWPSNMVTEDNGVLKINGSEFDKEITEAKQTAKKDNNDQEQIKKIEAIEQKKGELISLIKKKLEQSGYTVEII